MDKISFGLKIKKLRKIHHLTQEQLAEMINIDIRQIGRIETGESLPSLETFINICKSLDITPNEALNIKELDEIKSDIYDLLSLAKKEQLILIKKLILAIM